MGVATTDSTPLIASFLCASDFPHAFLYCTRDLPDPELCP